MSVHSAEFVKRHQKAPERELSIYGVEPTRKTWRLAQMNLAVHGLSGKILDADTYRDPVFEDVMKEAKGLRFRHCRDASPNTDFNSLSATPNPYNGAVSKCVIP